MDNKSKYQPVRKVNGEWQRWVDDDSPFSDDEGDWRRMTPEEVEDAKKEIPMMVRRDRADEIGQKIRGIFKKEKHGQ